MVVNEPASDNSARIPAAFANAAPPAPEPAPAVVSPTEDAKTGTGGQPGEGDKTTSSRSSKAADKKSSPNAVPAMRLLGWAIPIVAITGGVILYMHNPTLLGVLLAVAAFLALVVFGGWLIRKLRSSGSSGGGGSRRGASRGRAGGSRFGRSGGSRFGRGGGGGAGGSRFSRFGRGSAAGGSRFGGGRRAGAGAGTGSSSTRSTRTNGTSGGTGTRTAGSGTGAGRRGFGRKKTSTPGSGRTATGHSSTTRTAPGAGTSGSSTAGSRPGASAGKGKSTGKRGRLNPFRRNSSTSTRDSASGPGGAGKAPSSGGASGTSTGGGSRRSRNPLRRRRGTDGTSTADRARSRRASEDDIGGESTRPSRNRRSGGEHADRRNPFRRSRSRDETTVAPDKHTAAKSDTAPAAGSSSKTRFRRRGGAAEGTATPDPRAESGESKPKTKRQKLKGKAAHAADRQAPGAAAEKARQRNADRYLRHNPTDDAGHPLYPPRVTAKTSSAGHAQVDDGGFYSPPAAGRAGATSTTTGKEQNMNVDLSGLEQRIDTSTPEKARSTLTEAAGGARHKAGELDEAATTWRSKGAHAAASKHTAHLADGFYAEAAAAEKDADAVRGTAAAWEQQASQIA